MPNGDDAGIWNALNTFKQDYERRHSDLLGRLSTLEAQAPQWARREDVVRMEEAVKNFKESVERFETATAAMATKTDVDWLKKAYWAMFGMMTGIGASVAVHFLGLVK